MKTYGRPTWRVYDDERAAKKRRVDDYDEAEANLQYAIRESSAAVLSSPSRRNSTKLNPTTSKHPQAGICLSQAQAQGVSDRTLDRA